MDLSQSCRSTRKFLPDPVTPGAEPGDSEVLGESIRELSGPEPNSSESPRIGYAPLESQTKRWAMESPIEGSFPLSTRRTKRLESHRSRHGTTRNLVTDRSSRVGTPPRPACNRFPMGRLRKTGGGGRWVQELKTLRMGSVCLDTLPYRKKTYPGFGPAATKLPHLEHAKYSSSGQSAALDRSSSCSPSSTSRSRA